MDKTSSIPDSIVLINDSDWDIEEQAKICKDCFLETYRLKRQVISFPCEKIFSFWSILWCCCCCGPILTSIDNLIDVVRCHSCIACSFLWPVSIGFCVVSIVTLLFYIERSDVILTYPCITTHVWSSYEECPARCIKSYRYLEWRYPLPDGPRYGHNIAETWCKRNDYYCKPDAPALMAKARSYLNTSQHCWIHSNTGSYWRTIGAHGDDSPSESNQRYFNAVLGLFLFLVIISFLCCYCWRLWGLLEQIQKKRVQFHRLHTRPLYIFRRGVFKPTRMTPLYHFVNHSNFDRNVVKLIGCYLDRGFYNYHQQTRGNYI